MIDRTSLRGDAPRRCGVEANFFLVDDYASLTPPGFVVSLRAAGAPDSVAGVGITADQEASMYDLNITAAQDAADAEGLDAEMPDEARGHYATAEDADAAAEDYAASLHTGHPPIWPNYID